MIKLLSATLFSVVALAGAAGASTMTGIFTVFVANDTNLTSSQSEATVANFQNAILSGNFGLFTYDGALDFGTFDSNDNTTISSWLASGGGTVIDLDPSLGNLQLSKPNIGDGSATSTFFLFVMESLGAANFSVTHDDGMAIFDDTTRIGGFNGPNNQRVTEVKGFDGGLFELLYVATNGDPSVLKVDMSPVPVPASLPLILAGVGALAFLRRRART